MSVSSALRLTRAQASEPGSASASSSSGSTPPSRCFSEARITVRILANSAVSDMSGSLPRAPGTRSAWTRCAGRRRRAGLPVPGGCRRAPAVLRLLYLGLTNASAFSPIDTMSMVPCAKTAMGVPPLNSIALIGLVITQAVNVFA